MNKRTIIRSAIGLFFVGIILMLIMISSSRLVKDKVVDSAYSLSDELKTQINLNTHGLSDSEIAEYCLKLTLKELEFSKQNDINNGSANCVGYAQFFKSVCNYAYAVNTREVVVEHVRGYISCFGVNLCKVAKAIVPAKFKGFVKDHDFVEVDFGDHQYYLDPSLSDVFGITIMCRVDFIIPKGVRAYLGDKMNAANHYIVLVEKSHSDSWRKSVVDKAIRESPLPYRYYALSMFIFIKTLLSDSVKILPCILQDGKGLTQEESMKKLNEEYQQAKRLAQFEETDEQFLYSLKAGACHRQLNDNERKELLKDD